MKSIQSFQHDTEGINEVYNNGNWLISIKNWRALNDIANISRLEIHYTTDEQFVLLAGSAVLLYCYGFSEIDEIQVVKIEPGKVYNVPTGLWFNNVLSQDCKLIYIENSNAAENCNSEYRDMTEAQRVSVQTKIRSVMS